MIMNSNEPLKEDLLELLKNKIIKKEQENLKTQEKNRNDMIKEIRREIQNEVNRKEEL